MKKNLLLVVMCMFTIATYAKKEKETVVFNVPFHCHSCVEKVEKNIAFEKGVTGLKCDLKAQTAELTFRTDKTNVEKLKVSFKKIGFEVTVKGECCDKKEEKSCEPKTSNSNCS